MNKRCSPLQNHLLAALPGEVQDRLLPHLELVALPLHKVIYETGEAPRHVYFPVDTIVSLVHEMENGATVEIAVVGKEGFVGSTVFMGGRSFISQTVVQSAGNAYRLSKRQFMNEFNRHGELLDLMLRYIQVVIIQIAQTAVCNRYHTISQQLCRWLLFSLDRLPGNQLRMTQEQIANMLGVRREGVTDAAGKLHKLGIIKYSRGRIQVLDRPALERMSCECYFVGKQETDRLLPPPKHDESNS